MSVYEAADSAASRGEPPEEVRKFINSHFVLQTRRDVMPNTRKDRPMLQLRGRGRIRSQTIHCPPEANRESVMFALHRSDDLDVLAGLYALSSFPSAEKPSGAAGEGHAHFRHRTP